VVWKKGEIVPEREDEFVVREMLETSLKMLEGVKNWEALYLEEKLRGLASAEGWKAGELFMVLRVAVTGQKVTPPLFESMDILGKERSLRRIKRVLSLLEQDSSADA
jgi:glutamyl/glutaminyl-tRNA synthetase